MSKMTKDQVHKDMINAWTLALYEMIEKEVQLTELELEQLCFGAVEEALDKFFEYPPYNNYN